MSYILDEKETENNPESVADQPSKRQHVEQEKVKAEPEVDLAERLSELEEALKLEKSKSDDLLRRLQYLQADFENYRKRVDKEIGDVRKYGNERLLSDLLTVKDELELAYAKARTSSPRKA